MVEFVRWISGIWCKETPVFQGEIMEKKRKVTKIKHPKKQ
jgi:hypothetical protein